MTSEIEYNAHMARMQAAYMEEDAAKARMRPSVLFRPAIYKDGNEWCALYGVNIQNGVCGFGKSPELAAIAFDKAWVCEIEAEGRKE